MKSKPESQNPEEKKRNRQDWGIVLLILLLGFLCVCGAGEWALRLSPSWQLNTDMESRLNPNSDFLTGQPSGFVEPVDPSILTKPSWMRFFLTQGAVFSTGTPPPSGGQTTNNVPTQAQGTTVVPTAITNTAIIFTNTAAPTNTFIWLPPPAATATKKSGGGGNPSDTPIPPPAVVNADLQVVQVVDVPATVWYAAGTALTYQVTVRNNGPDAVTGATVTAARPLQVSAWDWACTPVVATCDGMLNAGDPFSDTVNLPSGGTITYTVTVTIPDPVVANGNLTFTVTITPPAGVTDTVANNSLADTNSPGVDLQIVKIPGAGAYTPGNPFSYTINVTNNSPFLVSAVTVTDIFSGQIVPGSISWNCAPLVGAPTCTAGAGNINDTINMPPNSSAQYTVSGTMEALAVGPLPNTATVTLPAGFVDVNPGNEISTTSTGGPGAAGGDVTIGPGNGNPPFLNLGFGGNPPSITMVVSPIIADGTSNYDFVFYERRAGANIELDRITIEISADGITWTPVFNWGDGNSGNNGSIGGSYCPGTEDDNCIIPIANPPLYSGTGIPIDIDAFLPPGSYSWIRLTNPPSDSGDGADVDAIQPYYP